LKKLNKHRQHKPTEYSYRCEAEGPVNNGLKNDCTFEYRFAEGTHHCPLCGNILVRVSTGPSVTELLRQGQRQEQEANKATTHKEGEKRQK